MGLVRALVIGLFILSIPVALITTNVRFAVSEQRVYDYSVRTYDAASVSRVPESELLRANAELRRYLTSDDPGPLSVQVGYASGQTGPLFNSREIAHMADVRALVQAVFSVQVVAVALALTLAVMMLVLFPPRALAAAALYGSLLTGGVLAFGGLLAISGFDGAWTQFHVLAFNNDLWQLDPRTDHLIQMFPEPFWQKITLLIGAASALEAMLLSAVCAGYMLLTRPVPAPGPVKPAPDLPGPGAHSRRQLAPPDPRLR